MQSLWTVTKRDQPQRIVRADRPYARAEEGQWLCLNEGRWTLAIGSGLNYDYQGNRDAGQLWNDLHAPKKAQTNYYPSVSDLHADIQWYGVGREIPFRAKSVQGNCQVFLRSLAANDLLARSLSGSVEGPDFQGMLRILSATSDSTHVDGRGWSLDTNIEVSVGKRWTGMLAIEGLMGTLRWNQLPAKDAFILSPRVFADPEGFYHQAGEISGIDTTQNLCLDLVPRTRMDLLRKGRTADLLLGCVAQGSDATPSVGTAYNRFRHWTPFTRIYPTESSYEVGAVGRGWLISIYADAWPFSAPKNLALDLSIGYGL